MMPTPSLQAWYSSWMQSRKDGFLKEPSRICAEESVPENSHTHELQL